MKLFFLLICFLMLGMSSFTPEKKFKLEFNEPEINALWNALDKSTAPHTDIKALQDIIQKQVSAQADTIKKK